jgi:hypothetical protein
VSVLVERDKKNRSKTCWNVWCEEHIINFWWPCSTSTSKRIHCNINQSPLINRKQIQINLSAKNDSTKREREIIVLECLELERRTDHSQNNDNERKLGNVHSNPMVSFNKQNPIIDSQYQHSGDCWRKNYLKEEHPQSFTNLLPRVGICK